MRYGRDSGGHSGGYGGGRGGGGGYGGGRGGGGGESFREAPVRSGEEYDVEITDVAAKGDGIAKVQGFIIFIAGARKGDRCRIRIAEVRNRFAIGEKIGEATAGAATEEVAEEVAEEGEETQ